MMEPLPIGYCLMKPSQADWSIEAMRSMRFVACEERHDDLRLVRWPWEISPEIAGRRVATTRRRVSLSIARRSSHDPTMLDTDGLAPLASPTASTDHKCCVASTVRIRPPHRDRSRFQAGREAEDVAARGSRPAARYRGRSSSPVPVPVGAPRRRAAPLAGMRRRAIANTSRAGAGSGGQQKAKRWEPDLHSRRNIPPPGGFRLRPGNGRIPCWGNCSFHEPSKPLAIILAES